MYISNTVRRLRTGRPSDETPWLHNKEMTKPCEVSDETSISYGYIVYIVRLYPIVHSYGDIGTFYLVASSLLACSVS